MTTASDTGHLLFDIHYYCSHHFKITHYIDNEMAYDVPKVVALDALGGAMLLWCNTSAPLAAITL